MINIPEISRCFNILNHLEYKKHFTQDDAYRLTHPFTYLIWFGACLCVPNNAYRDGIQCGFPTMEEACEHRAQFVKTMSVSHMAANTIGVVLRNSDIRMGKGTMQFHKAFRSVSEAHDYIIKQQDAIVKTDHRVRFICESDGSLTMLQGYGDGIYELNITNLY